MCLPLWGFLHSWCLGGFKPVRWASNPHDFCSIRRTIIGCGMAESLCFGCSNSHFGWLNFAYFALFLGNAGRVWCGSFGMPQGSPRGPLPVPWVGPEGSYQARELASLLWSLAASKQWQWGWDMLCQSDPGDHRCSRLVGALEHFLFSPIVGMMIQSDEYFSRGLNHQLEDVDLIQSRIVFFLAGDFHCLQMLIGQINVFPSERNIS